MAAMWPTPCTNVALINVSWRPREREQRLTLNARWKTDGDIGHRHRDKETLIVRLHEIDPFTYAIVDPSRDLRRRIKKENPKDFRLLFNVAQI